MKRILPLFILLIGAALLLGIAAKTSLNRTEVAHFGAAAYFGQTGKTDLFHVNPLIGKAVVGLSILFCRPNYDWKAYSPRPQDRSEWQVGADFVAANPPEKVWWMYFLGRLAGIPVIFLGGWFGFRFASEMYGYASGLIFTILWSFSPLLLGWGATICPDMMAASLGVVAVYWFRRWLQSPTWKHVAVAGICIGLLPLSKITWIVAFGLFPLIWLLAKNRPSWKQAVVATLIALYVLNMGYLFDGSFRPLKDYTFISQTLRGEGVNRFDDSIIGKIPVPLPAEFVLGIDTQKRDFEKGLESYLFGKYSEHGWWYYYLVVLVLRESFGSLLLFGLALGLTLFRKEYRSAWNDEILVLLPFFTMFVVVSAQTGFSIHPRYLLPALPFFYLFLSRTGKVFSTGSRVLKLAVALCLVATVGSSMAAYPCSMSYFNEIVPVRKRSEILLGSNIDWGQSAWFLRDYLHQHPEIEDIRIEYPCPEEIERIGIKTVDKPPTEPREGWFALGVNDVYAASGQYAWFKCVEPSAIVGGSIYIYHLSPDDADRIRAELKTKSTFP